MRNFSLYVVFLAAIIGGCQRHPSGDNPPSLNLSEIKPLSAQDLTLKKKGALSGNLEDIHDVSLYYLSSDQKDAVQEAGKWAMIGVRAGDCRSIEFITDIHFEFNYGIDRKKLLDLIDKYNCSHAKMSARWWVNHKMD